MPKVSTFLRALAAAAFVLVSAEWAPHQLNAAATPGLPVYAAHRQVRLDLDGDGAPDDGSVTGGVRVDVALTSNPIVRHLFIDGHDQIVGLTAIDIDRDGDLDLVADLASGSFAIWINQGHGDFERASGRRGPPVTLSTSSIASLPLVVGGFVTPRTPQSIASLSSTVTVLPRAPTARRPGNVVVATTLDPARPVRAPPASALL